MVKRQIWRSEFGTGTHCDLQNVNILPHIRASELAVLLTADPGSNLGKVINLRLKATFKV